MNAAAISSAIIRAIVQAGQITIGLGATKYKRSNNLLSQERKNIQKL